MMKYIPSTYEIMAFRSLHRDVDVRWVQWAADMILNGYETESVAILAGEFPPFYQFPMQELTTKVFQELSLDLSSKKKVIEDYVLYLIEDTLRGDREAFDVLRILYEIYFEVYNDDTIDVHSFYLLYYAKSDIMEYGDQHYWPYAEKHNIDSIIQEQFERWKDEHSSA